MTRDVHVLCEGYHDRDFLSGWFEHVAAWADPTNGGRTPLTLFAGEKPLKGSHVFQFQGATCRVSVARMGGRDHLRTRLSAWLKEIATLESAGYSGIVVVADGDHLPSDASDPVEDFVRQALVVAGSPPIGGLPWIHRGVSLDVVSMRAGSASDVQNLPERENLERVVATAFARAYPLRYRAMVDWLSKRPDRPATSSKTWTWSIMAAWFADQGCTDFLRHAIWQDKLMCEQLKTVLAATRLPQVEAALRAQ